MSLVDQIESIRQKKLQKDDQWYLLDSKVYSQLGSLSTINVDTIKENLKLKKNLVEEVDYVLLPKEAWNLIEENFAIVGLPIKRKVVDLMGSLFVEVYLVEFTVKADFRLHHFTKSRSFTMRQIKEEICQKLNKDASSVTLYLDNTELEDDELVNSLSNNDSLVLTTSKLPPPYNGYHGYGTRSQTSNAICGLTNIGNTCFMSSALQCLKSCKPLREYFLSGEYVNHLNRENPLGMGGRVAESFGSLIKEMESNSVVTPREFKHVISEFAPQFTGYRQHDSQELLAFLLDGLHEDLNRILNKPYVEAKDSDGRPDEEIAKESWNNYKLRNDSIIVDLFQAMFKSTLVCPTCNHISVTFDPFMYLSLPLPESKKSLRVTIVKNDLEFIEASVLMPRNSVVRDLKHKLKEQFGLKSLFVAEIFMSKIYSELDDSKAIRAIGSSDQIFVYEILDEVDSKEEVDSGEEIGSEQKLDCKENFESTDVSNSFASPSVSPLASTSVSYSVRWLNFKHGMSYFGFPIPITETSLEQVVRRLKPIVKEVDWDNVKISQRGNAVDVEIDSDSLDFTNINKLNELQDDLCVTLHDCLELFTRTESLGQDDLWYCPKCKQHKAASKKFDLWKMPKILVIHLKRFQFNRYSRDKIDTLVDFDEELEIGGFKYKLFAIDNHFGGLGGGHYTAFVKTYQWFNCDDSHVSPVNGFDKRAAYLLFYEMQ